MRSTRYHTLDSRNYQPARPTAVFSIFLPSLGRALYESKIQTLP